MGSIDATLDVSDWDLRKALGLLVRSNAVLIEWRTSPVRYRETGSVPARILDLARSTADLTALAYHYDHQARRSFDEIAKSDGAMRLKTYCYALRAVLALLWIRDLGAPPPMDLPTLMAGLALPDGVYQAVADLIARKAEAVEQETTARISAVDVLIGDALAEPVQKTRSIDRREVTAQADRLFASIRPRRCLDEQLLRAARQMVEAPHAVHPDDDSYKSLTQKLQRRVS
jgi:predicted nucleotidyltransferase